MSTLPAASAISDAANQGALKSLHEAVVACAKETPGGAAESELTVAAGVVTPTAAAHTVDTEGDAASDDLANILTTNHPEGRLLLLRLQDAARVVTVKHQAGGAGQVHLVDAADLALATDRCLLLQRRGADWHEVRPWPAATTSREGGVKIAGAAKAKALTDPAPAVSPADLAAVIADHRAFPGYKNRILNANMQVVQRGAATLSNAWQFGKVDMFEAKASGTVGAGTITRVVGNADLDSKGTYLDITGVTLSGGGEKLHIRTVIEAADIYDLYGDVASFQLRLWHDVGVTLNASVKVDKASGGTDNWSSEANVYTGAIILANGWNNIEIENISMGDCRNGLTVSIEIATGAITSKRFQTGKWQLERGSVCTSMEFRPFADELAKCQRFFDKSYELATAPGTVTLSGCLETTYRGSNRFYDQSVEKFKQRMRTTPTVTVYSTQTGASGKCSDLSSDYTATVQNLCERGFFIICGYPTANTELYWHWAAEAKIR